MDSFLYINGILQSSLSELDQDRSHGVFETLRARFKTEAHKRYALIAGLEYHYDRLSRGARYYSLDVPPLKEIRNTIIEALRLVATSKTPDAKIRIVAQGTCWSLAIAPWMPTLNFQSGATIKSVSLERENPDYKNCTADVSIRARSIAEELQYDEALLIDAQGIVREGAWSNFVWFNESIGLITAKRHVLPGVTLRILSEIADLQETPLIYKDYSLKDVLQSAQSAFITQATHGLVPVSKLDEMSLNTNATILNLRNGYEQLFERDSPLVTRVSLS